MLAVIFVQKIIDTGAHFKVLVHAVSGIGGNHGKTGAAVKIFAHHIGVLGIFRPKTTKCSGGPAVCGLQRGITFFEIPIWALFE